MIDARRLLVREILTQNDCVGAKFEKKAAITSKRYEIRRQLLLITNKKIAYGLSIGTDLDDLE